MRVALLIALLLAIAAPAAQAAPQSVTAPGLTATIQTDPWSLTFTDGAGKVVLQETDAGLGRLGYSRGSNWFHATRATNVAQLNGRLTATLATDRSARRHDRADGAGRRRPPHPRDRAGAVGRRRHRHRLRGDPERGLLRVRRALQRRRPARPGGHQPGRGRPLSAAGQRRTSSSSNPPYGEGERARLDLLPGAVAAVQPRLRRAHRRRQHEPLPPRRPGRRRVERGRRRPTCSASTSSAGPTPRRRCAASPPTPAASRVAAAPWVFGPWFQTGQPNTIPLDEEAGIIKKLRDADAPVSAAETQLHYLPCGAQQGLDDYLAKRTKQFHDAGLARPRLLQPDAVQQLPEPSTTRRPRPACCRRTPSGQPSSYPSFVGGDGPLGFTQEPIAQFDFSNRRDRAVLREAGQGRLRPRLRRLDGGLRRVHGAGRCLVRRHAGRGDAQPLPDRSTTARSARIEEKLKRPLARFQRSGWTGAAKCSDIVWGGDPTTIWGFDGLQLGDPSRRWHGHVRGVGRWGSDIGGYTSFGSGVPVAASRTRRSRRSC